MFLQLNLYEEREPTTPGVSRPLSLVVEGHAEQRPSDQTHPVAKQPSELVVEGHAMQRPSGQTHRCMVKSF